MSGSISKDKKAFSTDSSKRNNLGGKDRTKAENSEMIAYRFAGYPTEDQAHILSQFMGSCRFLWNRMLADINEARKNGEEFKVPSPASYKKVKGLEWLNEMDSLALCNVQLRLDAAFKKFFKSRKDKSFTYGHPVFKKKSDYKDSYTTNLANSGHPNIYLSGNLLKLPKIKNPIQLLVHRKIKENGILKNVTVTREPSGKWYFSLVFEYQKHDVAPKVQPGDPGIRHTGLDMSLPRLYIDSKGESADFCKPYHKLEKRIAFEQKILSRKVRGSNNYNKQKERIAALHAKAKHQRNDQLHKASCHLTNDNDVISIEDLDMSALKKCLRFGKSISDNGWGNFVRMLDYKARKKGVCLVKVSRWFPSSKECIHCGYVHKELKLDDREYVCPCCGYVMDRDYQAAMNIDMEGMRIFNQTEKCGDMAPAA